MSTALTITYGSTTLDMRAGGYQVIDPFYPQTPAQAGQNVTEQVSLAVKGSSESDLTGKIRALELALHHARAHVDDDPAYINFAPSATAASARSRIHGGQVLHDGRLSRRWRESKAVVSLVIERDGYWDEAEAQIPLTNDNGTGNTSGLAIYNCDDGSGSSPNKRVNYASVSGSDVDGDLPGPTRIELVNLNASASDEPVCIWIGQNYTHPADHVWNFEAESATLVGGSDYSGAAMSGGYYSACTLTGTGAYVDLFTWALTSGQVDAMAGRPFHAMARFAATVNTAVRYRLATTLETGGTDPYDFIGPTVYIDTGYAYIWRDLGLIHIPANLSYATSNAARNLILGAAYDTIGGTQDIQLDTLMLIPADGWRVLKSGLGYFPQNYRLIDDGPARRIYLDNGSGSSKSIGWSGYGNQILLEPGVDQRLYFIAHSKTADAAPITMKMTVKLYHRPRRLAV